MVNPIGEALGRMLEIGFFDILAFVLFLAIFYALFRKSKVLGESVVINGIAALAISFFIFLYPLTFGLSFVNNLTAFFAQSIVWILTFLLAFLIASFFYPNLPGMLAETFKRRTTLWALIGLAFSLIVTSGFISILWQGIVSPKPVAPGAAPPPPRDVLILVAGIIIFVVLIIIAAATARGE